MKILHTADWHIGRALYGTSLLEDQAVVLDELVRLAAAEAPDLLVVAGDVYDRAVPHHAAVELLDEILQRLVLDAEIPTAIIAGNHDSPERLGFGARLFAKENLFVRGRPSPDPKPITFRDAHGPVHVFLLPYASPAEVRESLGDESVIDHQTALAALMARVHQRRPQQERVVVVAHTFLTGARESESERPLVGGVTSVEHSLFEEVSYAALGHLHRPQKVHHKKLRYAGSLMKYSFSEADHHKSISIVELDAAGDVEIRELALKPPRDLRRISGTLAELVAAAPQDPGRLDYLEVTLMDPRTPFEPIRRLREVYPNVLHLNRPEPETPELAVRPSRDLRRVDDRTLFREFYREVTGSDPGATELWLYDQLVADLRTGGEAGAEEA